MIVVSLFEGLGNQMFQYAFARHLAEKHSTILKLDLSYFELHRKRRYGLHCFNIQEHLASQEEIDRLIKRPNSWIDKLLLGNRLEKLGFTAPKNSKLVQEKHFHFDENFLQTNNNVYLNGFWQTEKYFIDIKDILLCEFSIKYPQTSQNREISEKIKLYDSISIHVRRGDYITDKKNNDLYEVCSLQYYEDCLEYISGQIKNPHLFVFSDDQKWAKEHIKQNFPITFVENNCGYKCYEDLRLMSQCKHNIIANSSFSWWGAWLNTNNEKIVCAPQHWFKNNFKGTKFIVSNGLISWHKKFFWGTENNLIDIKDLIPDEWKKI